MITRCIIFAAPGFYISYRGNFSRTTNFAVFVDFTATSKINPQNLIIAYECNDSVVDPRNLISELF